MGKYDVAKMFVESKKPGLSSEGHPIAAKIENEVIAHRAAMRALETGDLSSYAAVLGVDETDLTSVRIGKLDEGKTAQAILASVPEVTQDHMKRLDEAVRRY